MTIEHIHAMQLFKVLRERVMNGEGTINGYHTAATAIGLDGEKYQRHMGQVCSRLDVATFDAGYSMLATHMVRTPDGGIHPDAFRDIWEMFRDECIDFAINHHWTVEQLNDVECALIKLKPIGALALWRNIAARESRQPGFIRYNLHRKVQR